MMMSCDNTLIEQVSAPAMVSFYQESLTLNTVAPDSVQRFSDKWIGYIQAHPVSKQDPLYPEIVENLGHTVRLNIIVPGWDDVEITKEFK